MLDNLRENSYNAVALKPVLLVVQKLLVSSRAHYSNKITPASFKDAGVILLPMLSSTCMRLIDTTNRVGTKRAAHQGMRSTQLCHVNLRCLLANVAFVFTLVKAIAKAMFGDDVLRVAGILFDFGAQPGEVDMDIFDVVLALPAPDLRQNRFIG